jgi:hypothetical protein
MIARTLLIASLAAGCTGCVGLMVDQPWTQEIRNPVPLKAEKFFGGPNDLDRWACQPGSGPAVPQTKDRFLGAWGVPKEKVPTAKGETWIYSESGRWCGLWVFFVLPLPILLPVCETFDHVVFEDERAVRSASRRMDGAGIGLGFHPAAMWPLPFLIRPARVTDVQPGVNIGPGADPQASCAP